MYKDREREGEKVYLEEGKSKQTLS